MGWRPRPHDPEKVKPGLGNGALGVRDNCEESTAKARSPSADPARARGVFRAPRLSSAAWRGDAPGHGGDQHGGNGRLDRPAPAGQSRLYERPAASAELVHRRHGQAARPLDAAAIRLPSVIALLLVVLLVYAYTRALVGRVGAFAAAVSYATFMQVLELGRTGETDLLFTLFVSAGLLLWHLGYRRGWPPLVVWMVAYGSIALATLTKGPQAPCYFAAAVGLFLVATRSWRYALSPAHLAGIALFACIVGAWYIPYCRMTGIREARHVFAGDVGMYVSRWHFVPYLAHLVSYPLEIFLGSWLPWSLLLIPYVRRDFRRSLGDAGATALYLAGCLAVAFPTVWLVPGTRSRFFMPLFPCAAILVGIVVERCTAADGKDGCGMVLHRFVRFVAALMFVAGPVVLGLSIRAHLSGAEIPFAQSLPVALVFLGVCLQLGVATLLNRRMDGSRQAIVALSSMGAFLALLYAGVIVNERTRTFLRYDADVARLRERLPAEARFVSLGEIHHFFTYQYYMEFGKLIPALPRVPAGQQPPAEVIWFCSDEKVAFAHEPVSTISYSRNKRKPPGKGCSSGGGCRAGEE